MIKKSLKERDCYVHFKWNPSLSAWDGYLIADESQTKRPREYTNGVPDSVTTFTYSTRLEVDVAATNWANLNTTKLSNRRSRLKRYW